MGQVHPRGGIELEVSPSTGPDPTIFRQQQYPHPNYQIPNYQFASPPPPTVPMQATRTDETYSRLDYTPSPTSPPISAGSGNSRTFGGIGLPRPGLGGFGSKQKTLGRKLSRKGPPAPIVTKKSMGPDPFEARPFSPLPPMESMGGLKSPEVMGEEYGVKTAKAGSFPNRSGQVEVRAQPNQQPASAVPFPVFASIAKLSGPITPTQSVTAVHRRVSSMTRSPRHSIRSTPSKRAEREWRAKVAGLAHTYRSNGAGPTTSPIAEPRGPVPPRRQVYPQPMAGNGDRSSSPEEDTLLTPGNSLPAISTIQQMENTPAKSFASNRSFETLGHYAHLSPRDADPGPRQCSVPQSVVSSFYFDQRASRVSTHLSPSPLATNNATLSPIPAEYTPSPSSPGPTHKASLPPFSSFHLSPASVGPPPSPTPSPHASPIVYPVRSVEELDSLPPLSLDKNPSNLSASSSQSRQRLHLSMQSQLPPLSPGPKTPVRQVRPVTISTPKSSCPGTPYSPTTAYILHTDNLDQHLFASAGDLDLSLSSDQRSSNGRGAQKHPYARTPSMLVDSPPRKSATRQVMPLRPRHEVISPPCRHVPALPSQSYSQETRSKRVVKGDAGGTAPLRYREKKVDLTPGMETGMRPPKSGLSMTDLERWLASTNIGSSR